MRRILFIDDEVEVLEGLRRSLHSLRHEWEMYFSTSAKEALRICETTPMDVVVSDMRMSEMNGADFLGEVSRRHPDTARLILSGYSDSQAILESVGVAHQFVAKPCEAAILKETVDRACKMRDRLAENQPLRALLSRIGKLPSPPALYSKIMTEVRSSDPSLNRVGEIISRDMAMSAKILQLVNSAFFGLRRQISSPAQAVSLLGMDTIASLALAAEIFGRCESGQLGGVAPEALWEHSLRCEALAKHLARFEGLSKAQIDISSMAGLLHDVGKLALASSLPREYGLLVAEAQATAVPLWKAEEQCWGTSHAGLGAFLLGLWGLPEELVEAVWLHHQPLESASEEPGPLMVVYVANVLAHALEDPRRDHERLDLKEDEYLRALQLEQRIPLWEKLAERILDAETD